MDPLFQNDQCAVAQAISCPELNVCNCVCIHKQHNPRVLYSFFIQLFIAYEQNKKFPICVTNSPPYWRPVTKTRDPRTHTSYRRIWARFDIGKCVLLLLWSLEAMRLGVNVDIAWKFGQWPDTFHSRSFKISRYVTIKRLIRYRNGSQVATEVFSTVKLDIHRNIYLTLPHSLGH